MKNFIRLSLALAAMLVFAACSDDAGKKDDVSTDTQAVDGDCCTAAACDAGQVCNPTTCTCGPAEDTISDDTRDVAEDTAGTDVTQDGGDDLGADTAQDTGNDQSSDTTATDTEQDTGPAPLDITWPATAAGYKPDIGAFVDRLFVAPPDSEGNPTCCMDFGHISRDYIQDQTDLIDNALGELLSVDLASMLDINGALDMSIQTGGLILLMDHKLLDGLDDPDGFVLTAMPGRYEGLTDYAVAAAGKGTFTINPEAFEPNSGKPATVFNPALMSGGSMTTAEEDFFLTIPLGGVALNIPLKHTRMTGTAVDRTDSTGFRVGYADGWISGYIYLDDFREAINTFVVSECGCLGLTDPLYGTGPSTWGPTQCMDAVTAENLCANPSPNETGCIALASNPACGILPFLLIGKADIDPDGNGYKAISMGLRYTAVPAELVGITP